MQLVLAHADIATAALPCRKVAVRTGARAAPTRMAALLASAVARRDVVFRDSLQPIALQEELDTLVCENSVEDLGELRAGGSHRC